MAAAPQVSRLKYRPYFPRRPYAPYGSGGGGGGGAFEAGTAAGKQVGSLIEAIGKAQAQAKQNQVANQLLNTNWAAPRAAYVGGTPLPAGVNPAGSAPATGGVEELNMRIAEAKARQQIQGEAARQANAAQAAQRAARGGGGGGRSPWRGGGSASRAINRAGGGGGQPGAKSGKPTPYVYDANNPQGDSFKSIQGDADAQYGKGGYNKLQQASGLVHLDDKTGKYVSDNEDIVKVNPDTGDMTFKDGTQISGADAGRYIQRSNAVRVQNGMEPQHLNTYTTQYPESGAKAGSQENPYAPKTAGEVAGLPAGSWVLNPADGKAYQKAPPAKGGQAGAPPPPADTAAASTDVDSDQAVLDEAAKIPSEGTDQGAADTGATTQAAPPPQGAPPPQVAAASYLPSQSADVNPTPFVARDSSPPTIAAAQPSTLPDQGAQPSTIAAAQPPVLPDQGQAPTAPDPQVADQIARAQAADQLSGGDQSDALERAIAQMRQNQGSVLA